MFLYHYYDKNIGPFKNLSDLSSDEANRVLQEIAITKPNVQCAKRNLDYMQARFYYENILRNEFKKKGGLIYRQAPHYMVVEHSPWLSTWYENSSFIKIPIEKFDIRVRRIKTVDKGYISRRSIEMKRKNIFILMICLVVLSLWACKKEEANKGTSENHETEKGKVENSWDIEQYESIEDIISIEKLDLNKTIPEGVKITTYKVRYKCDDCEVVSYLSVPNECIEKKEAYPCIIYNRGGNREYGANQPEYIAYLAETFGQIVFATQYRGVDGGTGREEFGGADLNDVLKLIDFCEEFAFVDTEQIYMMGISRGGMMTYMAAREDSRIKKAVVISGLADAFMAYEERNDMQTVFKELVKATPKTNPMEYENRSATYWANEIKCPILIIHSKLDESVSFEQAEKMVQELEKAGKEYKFVTYEDNVHGGRAEDMQIILEWCK